MSLYKLSSPSRASPSRASPFRRPESPSSPQTGRPSTPTSNTNAYRPSTPSRLGQSSWSGIKEAASLEDSKDGGEQEEEETTRDAISNGSPIKRLGVSRGGSRETTPTMTSTGAAARNTPNGTAHIRNDSAHSMDSQPSPSPSTRPLPMPDSRPLPTPDARPLPVPRPHTTPFVNNLTSNLAPAYAPSSSIDALSHLPPALVRSMREAFSILDRSSSNSVSRDDVGEMLTQLGLSSTPADLAAYFPPSGTTAHPLPLPAFLGTIGAPLAQMGPPGELLAALGAFDEGDEGVVDVNELLDALVGSSGLGPEEVREVMEGFVGKRAWDGRVGQGGLGIGGRKGEVFRYREWVQNMGAVSGGSGGGAGGSEGGG